MSERRSIEAERDMEATAFTLILRRIWEAISSVLVAAFVDQEGECIDYVSSLDPFDAKIHAAQVMAVVGSMLASKEKLRLGNIHTVEISTIERELWARRIDDEYTLVVVAIQGVERPILKNALIKAVRDFREEVGISRPCWEPVADTTYVETRSAVGWKYAPVSFCEKGNQVSISDVIGRWVELGDLQGREKVCFRVRTEYGQELTLVHDPAVDEWIYRI